MSAKTKLILGLVGAAAVGVCVGILLAPEKGADTRQRIKSTATDWSGQLSDLFASAKEGLSNMKSKGGNMAADVADKYSDVKESYS